MEKGKLIFLPVLVAQVTPITAGMPPKEIAGLFARFLERSEGTGRGDDLTQLKWIPHLAHRTHRF